MMHILRIWIIILLCAATQAAVASDDLGEIDKARVFPVQKNSVPHYSNTTSEFSNEYQSTTAPLIEADKKKPKDASLTINGNGGSTNRSAGGNAVLKKRFSFD